MLKGRDCSVMEKIKTKICLHIYILHFQSCQAEICGAVLNYTLWLLTEHFTPLARSCPSPPAALGKARWWCAGAGLHSADLSQHAHEKETRASLCARVCFPRLWIILLPWWRAHPCLILPDPLRLYWHPPFSSRLQRPHVVKGARKRRPKVCGGGREYCVFPHLLSTRPLLFTPDSLRVTVLDRRRAPCYLPAATL